MKPASPRTRSADRLREAMGWRRVRRPQRPVLFINPRSGGGTAVRLSLARRARDLGIEPVVLEPGQDLAALVADAVSRGADALGMAGGDGSMAVVAGAAAAHGLPFACVPAGTRNHFARDLGVLRHDVVGALEAFSTGLERSIDLGEVNGAPFVDNVVVGFYGDAIRREGYRDARLRTLVATARMPSDRARRRPESRWWTTEATSIATPRSSSSPTTPTRSSAPSRRRRVRGWTAAGSASWSSIGRRRGAPTVRGPRPRSRSPRRAPCTPGAMGRP